MHWAARGSSVSACASVSSGALQRRASVLVVVLVTAGPAIAQPGDASRLPALPVIALETFPSDARTALEATLVKASRAPRDAAAAGELGITLQPGEQCEAAHLAYQRAHVLAPTSVDWPYLDGMVLQRLVRPADAAVAFQDALKLTPALLPARARMAEALFDAGDLEASGRAYEALTTQPAAAPVGELGLGRVAARQGRHADAVTHLERAIALFPQFGEAYYGLAQSLRALGRLDE